MNADFAHALADEVEHANYTPHTARGFAWDGASPGRPWPPAPDNDDLSRQDAVRDAFHRRHSYGSAFQDGAPGCLFGISTALTYPARRLSADLFETWDLFGEMLDIDRPTRLRLIGAMLPADEHLAYLALDGWGMAEVLRRFADTGVLELLPTAMTVGA